MDEVTDRYLMSRPVYCIVRDEIMHEIREQDSGQLLMRLSVSSSLYSMQVKAAHKRLSLR